MTDPPTYRVEPEPGFADRLERLLLQRLTAAPDDHRAGRPVELGAGPDVADTRSEDHEGDIIMLETEDRPPIGDVPAPTRRPSGRWLLAAAAVALIAVIGAVLAAGGDDEDKIDTVVSTPDRPQPKDVRAATEAKIEPGSYFVDPDGDPSTPLRVIFDVAAEGWAGWLGTYKETPGRGRVILSITTVDNVTRNACSDQRPAEPAVGPTVDDLAAALSSLAPFTVTSPPSDVTISGYHGKHLELTVPELRVVNGRFPDCTEGNLHSWFSPLLGDDASASFWGYDQKPGATEEFWILDVDGTRLVLVTDQSPTSSSQDLAELQAIFDSIRIEP